jgi:hypothetical protein
MSPIVREELSEIEFNVKNVCHIWIYCYLISGEVEMCESPLILL